MKSGILNIKSFIYFIGLSLLAVSCYRFEEPPVQEPVKMETTMTIAQFKALYPGAPYEITDPSIVISGVVTSSDKSGNVYRSLYIEDETAGLEVKIGKTGLYNDYPCGMRLYIKPELLCLGAYGGSVQLGAASTQEKYETSYIDVQPLIDRTIFKGAMEKLPDALVISSSSDINDDAVCRFVKIMNASYQGSSSGLNTWAVKADSDLGIEAAYGEQNFKVGDKQIVVRTSGYASFADTKVGMEINDKCNISGILTKFNSTYQLVIIDLNDVEKL